MPYFSKFLICVGGRSAEVCSNHSATRGRSCRIPSGASGEEPSARSSDRNIIPDCRSKSASSVKLIVLPAIFPALLSMPMNAYCILKPGQGTENDEQCDTGRGSGLGAHCLWRGGE